MRRYRRIHAPKSAACLIERHKLSEDAHTVKVFDVPSTGL
jgi:hypothetical protein